jgi:putative ABC transport system permease protein
MTRDIRSGLRALRKSPGLATAAIVTFALGVGANAAIFSVVYAVLLRPLGYQDPSRLVVLDHSQNAPVAPATYLDWKGQARSFTDMAAAQMWGGSLRTDSRPEAISGLQMTANMFSVLGSRALIGRAFSPDEDRPGHAPVVVLGWSLWQRDFGGRSDVLGRQIVINGATFTVVGVMPEAFHFAPYWATNAEIWTPLVLSPRETDRYGRSLRVFARLKPGVTLAQAQAEMDTIMSRLAQAYPDSSAKTIAGVTSLNERVVGKVRPMLLVLLGAVGFVLLIACLNVASLMLARAAAKRREIAIRLAIGATRWHIARQAIVEGAILSTIGGAIGMLFAVAAFNAIANLLPKGAMPRQTELGLDAVAVGFTIVLSVGCGALSGLIPAWQSSRGNVNDALKQGGRPGTATAGSLRTRSLLIAGEMALAFLLLTGGGLLLHSFARLLSLDPGFAPDHLLTMEVSVAGTAESPAPRREYFYREAMGKIAAIPGVKSVSAINHVPISGDLWSTRYRIDGQPIPKPGEFPNAVYRVIEPGYFRTMQTTVLAGRDFSERDNLGASRVVIVNQAAARKYWPGGDAVGRRIISGRPGEGQVALTVVGIVHDVKQMDWQALPFEELYFPFLQSRDFLEDAGAHVASLWFVVRTAGDPSAMAAGVENVIHSIDRGVLVSGVTTMDHAIERNIWRQRLALFLLGVFSLVALALAVTGIYGVVSHSVAQRTQELGIRIALGAGRGAVLMMAVRQGMKPVWIGGVLGLLLALPLGRLMGSMLFQVKAVDPVTLASVALVLALAGLLANWWPALRASRVDPLVALRDE